MLGNVDAVHGLYYVLMHGWFQIFPTTEFWSRAPSGLAVGGAGAFVVVAENFNSFGNAITKKLIAEIAQAEPVSAASHYGDDPRMHRSMKDR